MGFKRSNISTSNQVINIKICNISPIKFSFSLSEHKDWRILRVESWLLISTWEITVVHDIWSSVAGGTITQEDATMILIKDEGKERESGEYILLKAKAVGVISPRVLRMECACVHLDGLTKMNRVGKTKNTTVLFRD